MKKIPHTERQLIKRCLKGKLDAQKQLYDNYAGRLMTLCRRYARDNMEAEDYLQEGFIKVFQNLEKFRGDGSLYGWIKTIMVHTALRQIKKRVHFEDVSHLELHLNEADALSQLQAEDLIGQIQNLPDGYRTIFNLYHIEGYSHKEIGDTLNIGESTSRSQLTKARKMLQSKIANLENISI